MPGDEFPSGLLHQVAELLGLDPVGCRIRHEPGGEAAWQAVIV